ncbi:MAG: hypothetical protein QM767_29875 [Anaeromyxobacter sp.]
MLRKLAVLLAAAALAPSAALARTLPDPAAHCSLCRSAVHAGGPATPVRSASASRGAPLALVLTGGPATDGKRPAVVTVNATGRAATHPGCTQGCCSAHRAATSTDDVRARASSSAAERPAPRAATSSDEARRAAPAAAVASGPAAPATSSDAARVTAAAAPRSGAIDGCPCHTA